MPTSLQLGQRLTRHLKVRDLGMATASDRATMLECANEALGEFFSLLPAHRKVAVRSHLLRTPVTQSIDILYGAVGFAYVGGSPYPVGGYGNEQGMIGHSVVVAGSPVLNRLNRSGELLMPYGGTSGQVQASFYDDCLQLGQHDVKLVAEPRWRGPGQTHSVPLIALSPEDRQSRWVDYPYIDAFQPGDPLYYWTEPHLAGERVATPMWTLRVWPIPVSGGLLNYSVDATPAALTFDDFFSPRDLPIEDLLWPSFLTLCEDRLSRTTLWDTDRLPLGTVQASTNTARAMLARHDRPTTSTAPAVGTPSDW